MNVTKPDMRTALLYFSCTCFVFISFHPRVEDPNIVVCCNECDQARYEDSTPVFFLHCKRSEPEEHGCCHHARESERQHIVYSLILHVTHFIHRHGWELESRKLFIF